MRYLSLFSGIEAASVAWHPLGWQPVAFAEVEPFPCSVLAHHYPDVPNLGDVTKIAPVDIAPLGRIDVVVGGSPCQDLSVAGQRKGLAGERSSLFHEQIRIFHAARYFCGARWLVWENVPGAFSSNGGADFAVVAGTMAGCILDVPTDGWGQEGVALGERGLLEWAVLDAQWFGLAQRRRRVFAVLDTGNWQDRPPVLLERDSLRGDTVPRRKSGEGTAATIAGGACQRGRDDIPDTSMCLNAGGMGRQDAESETLIPVTAFQCHGSSVGEMGTLRATGNVQSGVPFTLAVHGTQDPDTLIDKAHTLGRNQGQENVVYTLAERGRQGGHALEYRSDGTANALLTPNGGRAGMGIGAISVCKTANTKSNGLGISDDGAAYTLDTAPNQAIASDSYVRRLTPRECERLQGFPDDYTRIAWRGKPAEHCPDSPRYRVLGNSMAVPVMRWIGQQIDATMNFEHMEKVA